MTIMVRPWLGAYGPLQLALSAAGSAKLCRQRACVNEGKPTRPKRILLVGSARCREVRPPGVSSCLHVPHKHRGHADQEEQSRTLRCEWQAPRPREQPSRMLGDLTCENPSL